MEDHCLLVEDQADKDITGDKFSHVDGFEKAEFGIPAETVSYVCHSLLTVSQLPLKFVDK